MEQKKGPDDVAASVPDKENLCNDLITIIVPKSILTPLLTLGTALEHVHGNLFDVGLMRCATGTYLNFYFSGDIEIANPFSIDIKAIPDTASIPYAVLIDLMREMCVLARSATANKNTVDRILAERWGLE